jgi:hypothetical protein
MIYPPVGSPLFAEFLDEPSKATMSPSKTGEKPVDYGRLYRD